MLYYNSVSVNALLMAQVLAVGVCGTYFNFCIVGLVCIGYYFRDTIARTRRVYDNLHTTYVLFIVMCCGVSFVLQSFAFGASSRNMAFAKRPELADACQVAAFDSIDQLAAHNSNAACGISAYDRVLLQDQYTLSTHGSASILFYDALRFYSTSCNHTTLRCFRWCVHLEGGGDDECFRPAWSMVYNVFVTNARAVYAVVDTSKPRVQSWHFHTHTLAGGARISSRAPGGAILLFQSPVAGIQEVDRMSEPYTDEYLVIDPEDPLQSSSISLRLRPRCVTGNHVCTDTRDSLSVSITRLSQSAAVAPYTILPVAANCNTAPDVPCDLSLGVIVLAHVINTLVLIASVYVALLTHALDEECNPVLVILATVSVFTLNWVCLVSLAIILDRRVHIISLRGVLLATVQIAQVSVLLYEMYSLNYGHVGQSVFFRDSVQHWTFWLLAPATLLQGPVFVLSSVLGIAGTVVVFLDSLHLLRLYERPFDTA